jgi:hypothetical protein
LRICVGSTPLRRVCGCSASGIWEVGSTTTDGAPDPECADAECGEAEAADAPPPGAALGRSGLSAAGGTESRPSSSLLKDQTMELTKRREFRARRYSSGGPRGPLGLHPSHQKCIRMEMAPSPLR